MLRSILAGNKTQTRRPVKPQPRFIDKDEPNAELMNALMRSTMKCPYGKPGDRLQVKDGPVLEITEVRAERVQDISIRDALAEGINCPSCGYTAVDAGTHMDHAICVNKWLIESKVKDVGDHEAIAAYHSLWDSIYHKKPDLNWDANPFVWVISFKVVNP